MYQNKAAANVSPSGLLRNISNEQPLLNYQSGTRFNQPMVNIGCSLNSCVPTRSAISTSHTMVMDNEGLVNPGTGHNTYSMRHSLEPAVTVPPGEDVASKFVHNSHKSSCLDSNPAIQVNQCSSRCGLS